MSNDCRTQCRGCNHYVDLVAGQCPVCDEVYYDDSEDAHSEKENVTDKVVMVFDMDINGNINTDDEEF